MKIMQLTPGTGHFYCGSCLRDDVLGKAMRRMGHEVTVVPLYLPQVLEEPAEVEPEVHMGGINMYLAQKTKMARFLPRWLSGLLDRPGLLRWASRRGNLTEASDLGEMTLSMLRGEHGHQAKELDKLVSWIEASEAPDVILISNVMLSGIVRRLKAELQRPVICSLQGEAPFLDSLPEEFSKAAWAELRERVKDIDAFVAVSNSYGSLMNERLGLGSDGARVIHNGLDLSELDEHSRPLAERRPRTIGYLARMCRDKGLHTLVDAFCLLKARGEVPDVRLSVVGVKLKEDEAFVEAQRDKLRAAGILDQASFMPNVERSAKLDFLRSLSVLSVPATYGESFGLYLLEAWAFGLPVVQPRHASFPELLEASGGGILCDADDAASLAEALEELLLDEAKAQSLADSGRRAVFEHFNDDRMAQNFAELCESVRQKTAHRA
ncbi:MAG: glycosyltransferase family 4 protein [Planctomycetota bacterium]|jgi:glycosyltransferase involved in cell wall biosynthesis